MVIWSRHAGMTLFAALLGGACSKSSTTEATAGTPPAAESASHANREAGAVAKAAVPVGPPADLNILLITVDSLRADMPWAGYERPIAPNLTALEKRAVTYTHGYALSSYTS